MRPSVVPLIVFEPRLPSRPLEVDAERNSCSTSTDRRGATALNDPSSMIVSKTLCECMAPEDSLKTLCEAFRQVSCFWRELYLLSCE